MIVNFSQTQTPFGVASAGGITVFIPRGLAKKRIVARIIDFATTNSYHYIYDKNVVIAYNNQALDCVSYTFNHSINYSKLKKSLQHFADHMDATIFLQAGCEYIVFKKSLDF